MTMKSKLLHNLISFLILVVILLSWQVFSFSEKLKFFFGSPYLIYQSLISNSVILIKGLAITGYEAIFGFVIGVTLGTIFGFLLWYSPLVARISKPYLVVAGAIPVFAFAPIIILWFGIGVEMKIALAAFGTFLISLNQSYDGARHIDLEEFNLLKIFGATRSQVLFKVIFPSSLSWVLSSMKLNIGFALLGAFIGEFISSDKGLGYFMIKSGSLYDIPSVFAGAIFLIILALFFNLIVVLVEKNKMKIVQFFGVSSQIKKLLN